MRLTGWVLLKDFAVAEKIVLVDGGRWRRWRSSLDHNDILHYRQSIWGPMNCWSNLVKELLAWVKKSNGLHCEPNLCVRKTDRNGNLGDMSWQLTRKSFKLVLLEMQSQHVYHLDDTAVLKWDNNWNISSFDHCISDKWCCSVVSASAAFVSYHCLKIYRETHCIPKVHACFTYEHPPSQSYNPFESQLFSTKVVWALCCMCLLDNCSSPAPDVILLHRHVSPHSSSLLNWCHHLKFLPYKSC